MRRPAYDIIKRSMVEAAVCAAAGALVLLPSLVGGRPVATSALALAGATWVAALVLLMRGWRHAHRFGLGIERLRSSVLNLVADHDALLPESLDGGTPVEIEAMLGSLALYQGQVTRERNAPDHRLVAIVGSLFSGVVVITEQGQVSLANGSARELLGAERVRVGTSIFASLERASVVAGVAKAAAKGRTLDTVFRRVDGVDLQGRVAALVGGEGAILIFPRVEVDRHRPGVDFDLGLHDAPPAAAPLTLTTSLDDLPAVVMDTETTGLDVVQDRIVSLGAVCAHGTRLFRSRVIDSLIAPGVPIPPASTTVHGITDAMVADARPFPEVNADYERMARNRVVIGHNVPFDLTILKHECARHGRPWEAPVFIDTLRLASLLNPTLQRHDLETLAEIYGIDVHGRHTALGDAMVTAELFFRLLPRLQQQGITSLGDLLRFHCTEAVDIIAGQRQAGWITEQPAALRAQAD